MILNNKWIKEVPTQSDKNETFQNPKPGEWPIITYVKIMSFPPVGGPQTITRWSVILRRYLMM